MTLILNNKQKVPLSVSFQDEAGLDVVVTGSIVWLSSNLEAVTLEVVDNFNVVARTVDAAVANSTITATLGNLTATLDVNVVNEGDEVNTGTAVSAKFTVGTIQPK